MDSDEKMPVALRDAKVGDHVLCLTRGLEKDKQERQELEREQKDRAAKRKALRTAWAAHMLRALVKVPSIYSRDDDKLCAQFMDYVVGEINNWTESAPEPSVLIEQFLEGLEESK